MNTLSHFTTRFEAVRELANRGLLLQAWELANETGSFPSLNSPEEIVLAGRMAWQMGGGTRSRWLLRNAWRRHPDNWEVRYYRGYRIVERHGPYLASRFLIANGEPPKYVDVELRASWFALHGQIAASLRDFDVAEEWLARADAIAPHSAWVHVCWSHLFECEDRNDEALDISRRALELRLYYRPEVQALGHRLSLRERDDEPIQLAKRLPRQSEHWKEFNHRLGKRKSPNVVSAAIANRWL